jgi:hypothetical protein
MGQTFLTLGLASDNTAFFHHFLLLALSSDSFRQNPPALLVRHLSRCLPRQFVIRLRTKSGSVALALTPCEVESHLDFCISYALQQALLIFLCFSQAQQQLEDEFTTCETVYESLKTDRFRPPPA